MERQTTLSRTRRIRDVIRLSFLNDDLLLAYFLLFHNTENNVAFILRVGKEINLNLERMSRYKFRLSQDYIISTLLFFMNSES